MIFTLEMDLGNAAFEGDHERDEVARLLSQTARRVLAGNSDGALVDANGNSVGRYEFCV